MIREHNTLAIVRLSFFAFLSLAIAFGSTEALSVFAQDDTATPVPVDRGFEIEGPEVIQQWDAGSTIAALTLDPVTGDTLIVSDDGTLRSFDLDGNKTGETKLLDYDWIAHATGGKLPSSTGRGMWVASTSGTLIGDLDDLGLVFLDGRGGGAVKYGQDWVFAFGDGSVANTTVVPFARMFPDMVPDGISLTFFRPEVDDEVIVGFTDADGQLHVARLSSDGIINHWYVPELDSDQSSLLLPAVQAARESANRVTVEPDGTVGLVGANRGGDAILVRLSPDDPTQPTIQALTTCKAEGGCGEMVVINHEEMVLVGHRDPTGSVKLLQVDPAGLVTSFNLGMPPSLFNRGEVDGPLHFIWGGDGPSLIAGNQLSRIGTDGSLQQLLIDSDFSGNRLVTPGLNRNSLIVADENGLISLLALN